VPDPAGGDTPDSGTEAGDGSAPASASGSGEGDGSASGPEEVKIGVNGTQVAASVLASVSAAVVASFFGVAGTIVGTAVVSVVATVGSAAYGLGIHRTKARLQQVQSLRMVRPPTLPFGRLGAGASGDAATGATATSTDGPDGGRDGASWRDRLAQRRWGVAAGVAIVFAISLVSVSLIELVGPGPLSGEARGSGRTSIGALISGGSDGDADADDGGPGTPTTLEPPAGSPSTTGPADDDGGEPTGSVGDTDSSTSTTSTASTTAPTTTSTTGSTTTTPTTVAPAPDTAPAG